MTDTLNPPTSTAIEKFDLSPRNATEAVELAKLMSKSELVPKQYQGRAGDIVIAIQMGAEFGLKPIQALNSIAVINGRPTLWGDAVLGIVRASGLLVEIEEREAPEALKAGEGSCTVRRKGEEKSVTRTFSMEAAKTAKLIENGGPMSPWTKYPGRMLQMRARSWALRDVFPDVLKGLMIREEQEDVVDAEGVTVSRPREPRRRSEPLKAGDADRLGKVLEPERAPSVGHASAAGGQAPAEPANVWRGKLTGATKKTSPKGKSYYEIKGDGFLCTTFSDSSFELATRIQAAGEVAQVAYAVNGQYKNMTDIVSVGAGEVEPAGAGAEG